MLVDAGADGEDVRIEDDVLRRKAHLLSENFVRARTNLDFPCGGVGLALFVERHHDHSGAVAAHEARLPQELLFALLQRNGVYDALAL